MIPTEQGFYWAKTDDSFKWWNLIVHIWGNRPYLNWEAWDINGRIIKGHTEPDFIFSHKIPVPREDY